MSWRPEFVGSARCSLVMGDVPCKGRPRFDGRTGRTYTPAKTGLFEREIREAWMEQVGDIWESFAGEVRVHVQVLRPLSKSTPKSQAGKADLSKPDVDNVGKVVLDALNGVAYLDDRQVAGLAVERLPRPPHAQGVAVRIEVGYYVDVFETEWATKGDGYERDQG